MGLNTALKSAGERGATGLERVSVKGVWDGRSRMRKQGGWVSELEGISKEVDAEGWIRRDQVRNVNRRMSRGFDVQGRRKVSCSGVSRRDLKREHNPAARVKDSPERAFAVANLEAYLKERGPNSVLKECPGFSPSSRLLQARLQKQQLVKCPSNVSESSVGGKWLVRTYGSANEVDSVVDRDDMQALQSERSGCRMPWHWPSNSSQRMNGNPCFTVNSKRGSRRNGMSHKYSSERSVSSLDSESDTIPLMTEPEPFLDYSDDIAGPSMEVGIESRVRHDHSNNLTRFKDGVLSNVPEQSKNVVARRKQARHRSLSQKYRPRSFKELIGQNMVAESLSNAILRAKIAPVYLFHGPRGTGKTTAAKIFTNAMNCLSIEELRPCGLCKECTAFNTGQNYDVKQVDAAENNDVESMRLLLKLVLLPPLSSRYKVFIIDDCHALTTEAWNALLKSLEEPPSYVVFILITTDLEQLPRTAISRCQKFMFPRVKDADIVLRLRRLALEERVEIDVEALQFIASRSDGSFRDAENTLDQLSLLGTKVALATVQEMVGLIPDAKLVKLLELALAGSTVSTVNAIRELMESGVEPLALTAQLATLITDILAGKDRVTENKVMTVRKEEQGRLKHVLMILSEAEKQLRSCSDRATWLTAAFLQFGPKEPCPAPSSSRGTSVTHSPITFLDTNQKETFAATRLSLGGDERWEPNFLSKRDLADSLHGGCKLDRGLQEQTDNHVHHFSVALCDNRIHPCNQSPKSCMSKWNSESAGCPSTGTGNTEQRENSTMSPSTTDSIWRKVLEGSHSNGLKHILQGKAKLVSLSVNRDFAVACVEFGHPDHKFLAERVRTNIATAFQLALGRPLEVEIILFSPASDMKLVGRNKRCSVQHNAEHPSGHANQEVGFSQDTRRIRGGSFRKSSTSFRSSGPGTSSPLHHSLERRRPRQSFGTETRTKSRGSIGVSVKDVINSHAAERLCGSSRHVQDCEEKGEGVATPHGSGNEDDGSEGLPDTDRDAPGALCWKEVKCSDNKGRRHIRRRRRKGRLLLRLLPCAKVGRRSLH